MKTCPSCKKENSEIAIVCERCQFPFEGTEKEKAIHIAQFISKKGVKYDKDEYLKKSQMVLGFIAALDIIYLMFTYNFLPDTVLYTNVFMILLFAFCAITIRQAPIIKILIPLSILCVSSLLMVLINASAFFVPLVFRGIYIAILGYTLYMIRSTQKFSQKYED
jgi:hypothetical protein